MLPGDIMGLYGGEDEDEEKKSKLKSGRLFFTGLICLLLLFTIVPRAKTIVELSTRKEELQKEKAALIKINSEHKKELVELKSPEAIETNRQGTTGYGQKWRKSCNRANT